MNPLIIGVALNFIGRIVKSEQGRKFTERLVVNAINSPNENGMADICAHYIAGTIALGSKQGQSHWPQYPSNAITGEKEFIPIDN